MACALIRIARCIRAAADQGFFLVTCGALISCGCARLAYCHDVRLRHAATCCWVVVTAAACTHTDVVAPTKTMAPSLAVYVPPPGEGGVVCTGYLKGRAFGGRAGYIDYGHLC